MLRRSKIAARRSRVSLSDHLEPRTLLATLVSATKLTYQDKDGDNVDVTFGKSILTAGNVNTIFAFDTGTVDGSNATKQQLKTINLVGVAGAAGTTITTKAVHSAANGGDGFAALGQIDTTGLDIGNVTIDGDLGRILAGDATTSTQGLGSLVVHSMGRFETFTGATNLQTVIQGKLASLKSASDINRASINIEGGANGQLGSLTIGGSLLAGSIFARGNIGSVTISGDIDGSTPNNGGTIVALGNLASLTVGGSLLGGAGLSSGFVTSSGDMGAVKFGKDVLGGSGVGSGRISSTGKIASVTIGRSLIGGLGIGSGVIQSTLDMGAVKIDGNIEGAGGSGSGQLVSQAKLASVTIGGSLLGGSGFGSGQISAAFDIAALTIDNDLVGGSANGSSTLENSGLIIAGRIGTLTISGSLIAGTDNTSGTFRNNGAIRVTDDIANLTIKGNLVGNLTNKALITARGQSIPAGTTDLAIGKLTVNGRVEFAQVLAGVNSADTPVAVNADAQIGPVIVKGDWIASDLVAGAVAGGDGKFGTTDDAKISGSGAKDVTTVFSKIVSINIGGQAFGTFASSTDHFGFVAENIGSFKVKGGTTTFALVTGNGNDDFFVGLFNDLKVNEI